MARNLLATLAVLTLVVAVPVLAHSVLGEALAAARDQLLLLPGPFQPSSGIIAASQVQSMSVSLGSFVLTWSSEQGSLSVAHVDEPRRQLWSSIPGKPFLSSAIGHDVFGPGDGNFDAKQDNRHRTRFQQISSIELVRSCNTAGDSCVRFRGNLAESKAAVVGDAIEYISEWTAVSDKELRISFRLLGGETDGFDRLFLTYALDSNEKVYGLGEQFTYPNLVGHVVPIISREQGVGRGLQPLSFLLDLVAKGNAGNPFTTYTAVPHYITSKSRSVFFENSEFAIFDFSKKGHVEVQITSREVVMHVLAGRSPKENVEIYTASWSGRMPPLPEWLNRGGAIAGFQGGRKRAEDIVAQLRENDVPTAAIWIQDWCGTRTQTLGNRVQKRVWWNWDWDRVLYPDFPQFVQNLRDQDVRTLVYVNPFLADVTNKSTGYTRNFRAEALQLGHLVLNTNGLPYPILSGPNFDASLVDIRDPAAFEWLKNVLKENVLAKGVGGFMHDFGEWMPMADDVAERNGIDAIKYHNVYPVEWSRLTQGAIREAALENEILYFSRSGGARSPGFSRLFWAGDQIPTWDKYDGIKSALLGMLTGGLSGYSLTHSDIGGFTTVVGYDVPFTTKTRSRELLFRWMELSAFTAAYRTHEGSVPTENAQFYDDEETFKLFGRGAKIYVSLADYRTRVMNEAHTLGYPLMRFLWLEFPEDENAYLVNYQYMLGPDLLVAPVLDKDVATVDAYLPAGTWINPWTGKAIVSRGEHVKESAPIGRPIAWIRGPSVPADLEPFVALVQSIRD